MSRQLVFNAIWNRAAQMAMRCMSPGDCGCRGPQNGDPYCPCRMSVLAGREAMFVLARPPKRDSTDVR